MSTPLPKAPALELESSLGRSCDVLSAPDASSFASYPASWYFFGPSSSVQKPGGSPVSRQLAGERVVVYRGADGVLRALDAHCCHMGADLAGGEVEGNCICCPFHGWQYDGDGRCVMVPSGAPPPFARQGVHPVVERDGCIFVFRGSSLQAFPLPTFSALPREGLVPGRPFRFDGPWPWYVTFANGFDIQHMTCVHDRKLLGEPIVEELGFHGRRLRYRTEVCGRSLADRALRAFVGTEVDVTIDFWGGTMAWVIARFRHATSYVLITFDPRDNDTTHLQLVPFQRNTLWNRSPIGRLSLELRRLLTISFLRHDLDDLGEVIYRPGTLVEADRNLIQAYRWLADLPAVEPESTG
ncbi:MAG: Rieske (2Fe-2S) protein [Thermoanaerobaculia bacterium]|nr:Rieske (2Fe-2S) protein [Thermoanaerobaculia bacterium]